MFVVIICRWWRGGGEDGRCRALYPTTTVEIKQRSSSLFCQQYDFDASSLRLNLLPNESRPSMIYSGPADVCHHRELGLGDWGRQTS